MFSVATPPAPLGAEYSRSRPGVLTACRNLDTGIIVPRTVWCHVGNWAFGCHAVCPGNRTLVSTAAAQKLGGADLMSLGQRRHPHPGEPFLSPREQGAVSLHNFLEFLQD